MEFLVLDSPVPLIIGTPTLRHFNMNSDYASDTTQFQPKAALYMLRISHLLIDQWTERNKRENLHPIIATLVGQTPKKSRKAPLSAAFNKDEEENRAKNFMRLSENDPNVVQYSDLAATWHQNPPDSIEPDPLNPQYDGATSEEMRPERFPPELWRLVSSVDKPLVKEWWINYSEEEINKNIEDLTDNLHICKQRPNQRPYFLAQAIAHMRAFFHPGGGVKRIPGEDFDIKLTDYTPIVSRARKRTTMMEAFLEVKITDLAYKTYIDKSRSEWGQPILLVSNEPNIKAFISKHGDNTMAAIRDQKNKTEVLALYRLTMDLRELNKRTVVERWPMPNIQDEINEFAGCHHICTADIGEAFFMVNMKEESRYMTAFSTKLGHFQWCVMIMGATNAARFLCKIMQKWLRDRPPGVGNYMDDLFANAQKFFETLEQMRYMYLKVKDMQICLKLSKVYVNMCKARVLGHVISYGGFRVPDPKLIEKVTSLAERLYTKEEVSSFLGLIGYMRDYIPHLADVARPLEEIRQQAGNMANWTDSVHGEAIRALKRVLIHPTYLALYDPHRKVRLLVDSSTAHSCGCVATQYYGNDKEAAYKSTSTMGWRVFGYHSEKITLPTTSPIKGAGDTWYAPCTEMYGLHSAVKHFENELDNGIPFQVVMDAQGIVFLLKATASTANKVIAKMVLELQSKSFDVLFSKGSQHIQADAISRLLTFDDRQQQQLSDPRKWFGPVTKDDLDAIEGIVDTMTNKGQQMAEFDRQFKLTSEIYRKGRLALAERDYLLEGEDHLDLADPLPVDFPPQEDIYINAMSARLAWCHDQENGDFNRLPGDTSRLYIYPNPPIHTTAGLHFAPEDNMRVIMGETKEGEEEIAYQEALYDPHQANKEAVAVETSRRRSTYIGSGTRIQRAFSAVKALTRRYSDKTEVIGEISQALLQGSAVGNGSEAGTSSDGSQESSDTEYEDWYKKLEVYEAIPDRRVVRLDESEEANRYQSKEYDPFDTKLVEIDNSDGSADTWRLHTNLVTQEAVLLPQRAGPSLIFNPVLTRSTANTSTTQEEHTPAAALEAPQGPAGPAEPPLILPRRPHYRPGTQRAAEEKEERERTLRATPAREERTEAVRVRTDPQQYPEPTTERTAIERYHKVKAALTLQKNRLLAIEAEMRAEGLRPPRAGGHQPVTHRAGHQRDRDAEERRARVTDGECRADTARNVIGRRYVDPTDEELYEVTDIKYLPDIDKVVANRKPADAVHGSELDELPYLVARMV